MRPTNLRYRSPKEKTGEYVYPQMTSNGLSLTSAPVYPKQKSTFPRGQRWAHIQDVCKRTSYRVGPGCYNYSFSTNKGASPKMRPETALSTSPERKVEFIYVGDALIRQEKPNNRFKTLEKDEKSKSLTNMMLYGNRTESDTHGYSFSRSSSRVKGKQLKLSLVTSSRVTASTLLQTDPGSASPFRRTNDSWISPPESPYRKNTKLTADKIRIKRAVMGKTTDSFNGQTLNDGLSKTQASLSSIATSPKSKINLELLKKFVIPRKIDLN